MNQIDQLNTCQSAEAVRDLLRGQTLDMFLFLATGQSPRWVNQGQASIGGKIQGFSNHVQEFAVEYDTLYDESQKPKNRGVLNLFTHAGTAKHSTCDDTIHLRLQIIDDVIRGAMWHGTGCPICIASCSIMTEMIRGLSVTGALYQYVFFRGMMLKVSDLQNDQLMLGLLIFEPLRQNPRKTECVLLPWEALRRATNLSTLQEPVP